jgi:hypothetical protein
MALLHIRGKEKSRGMRRHQEIPSFQSSLLLKSADDRQKKMQYQKTEDRKAIRKRAAGLSSL